MWCLRSRKGASCRLVATGSASYTMKRISFGRSRKRNDLVVPLSAGAGAGSGSGFRSGRTEKIEAAIDSGCGLLDPADCKKAEAEAFAAVVQLEIVETARCLDLALTMMSKSRATAVKGLTSP
jgi:hypothetical protein